MLYWNEFKSLGVSSKGFVPLFSGQYSLWLEKELYSADSCNLFNFVIKIKGDFNVEGAQKAVEFLFHRYGAMRTVFSPCNGVPIQKELGSFPSIQICDGIYFPTPPFNLSKESPFRFFLYKSFHNEYYFQIVAHHIAITLRGYLTIFREFAKLYNGESLSEQEEVGYPCFVGKYYEYFQEEKFHVDKNYWKEYLLGSSFQADRFSYEMDKKVYFLELEEGVVNAIRQIALSHDATIFSFMVTIFQILQAFSWKSEESVVGIPFDITSAVIEKPVVGFTMNTLPLQSRVFRGSLFSQILSNVRENMRAMFVHRLCPTLEIMNNVQLFKTLVVSQKVDVEANCLNGVVAEMETTTFPTGRFNFALAVVESKGAVTLAFHYNAILFHKDRVVEIANRFLEIVKEVIVDPHKKIEKLEKKNDREF